MKNKYFYSTVILAIAIIATVNIKNNINIKTLSDISMANIEALANDQETSSVKCSITLNCYDNYGNLITSTTCSSDTGDCTSGEEGLVFPTKYIKCEGHKYTC